METGLATHVGECRIRNESDQQFKRDVIADLTSLKLSRAKLAGWVAGAAAVGTIVVDIAKALLGN